MADPIYHFTDTCRLPWIINTGELQSNNNFIGNFPKDVLWATTDPLGDRTSSAQFQQHAYRQGVVQLIRFTLPGEEFGHWREVLAKFPAWTDRDVEALVKAARGVGVSERNWRCRVESLPLSTAIAVHAKSYLTGRWVPVTATSEYCISFYDDNMRGFVIDGVAYCATRLKQPSGATGYGDLMLVDVERA